jgi:hypothetical protein
MGSNDAGANGFYKLPIIDPISIDLLKETKGWEYVDKYGEELSFCYCDIFDAGKLVFRKIPENFSGNSHLSLEVSDLDSVATLYLPHIKYMWELDRLYTALTGKEFEYNQ